MIKKYTNDEITIVWKPEVCIHSKVCWDKIKGLPEVFKPGERPWIRMEASSSERIMEQVNKCPSGALSYYHNADEQAKKEERIKVEVKENGPLVIHGNILIKDQQNRETERDQVTALCRCGSSANKPYCDGSHVRENFKG